MHNRPFCDGHHIVKEKPANRHMALSNKSWPIAPLSLQAQSVKAALELLKPLDHQRWQRQRARRQRRTLVEPLQFDMLRHGVDLLALGLRFATFPRRGSPPYAAFGAVRT